MWFKGIVTVTCFAALAAIGSYFWDRHQTEQRALAIAQNRANGQVCDKLLSDLAHNQPGDHKRGEIGWCVANNYLSEQEFRDNGAIAYYDDAKDTISLFTKD